MATLTGKKIKNTYKDLLQVSNSNSGIDSTLRAISDGEATDSVLQISSSAINISSAGALQYAGTAITSTAAELNILDGVTSSTAELNILDGVTASTAELNILDGVTSTTAELNILDGVTSTAAELNVLDGYTGSVTELNYLDTLHATGVTSTEFDFLDGVTSNIQTQLDSKISATLTQEQVEDFVGGMLDGTETGISVSYDDTDGNIDFVVATQSDNNFTTTLLNKLNAIEASADVTDTANVTSAGALMDSEVSNLSFVKGLTKGISDGNVLTANDAVADNDFLRIDGTEVEGRSAAEVRSDLNVEDGATADQTASEIKTLVGNASDSNVFTDADHSKLDGIEASADVTDATNVTAAGALMDSELTSIADVKALDQSVVSGASPTFTTTNFTDASNKRFMTDAQETKLDSVESNATADQTDEEIQDIVGAMLTGNTETGITVTYQDGDGTIDFVVGTLNQDTTGSAATLTTARNIGGVSFDGSANIDLPGVNTAGNQNTSGTAANATLAATVTVSDSTANTNFPVVFHDESNALLDDTGALRYNPSTGTLLVPNLSVSGTTTTVDTVTMEASNAIIFEGATADANETTLSIIDPTGDRTINLPNVSGTIPVLAAASTTQISSTPEELNILDGKSFLDEDDFASDSATGIASQQSIKAYVDNEITAAGAGDITAVTFQTDSGSGSKASDTGGSADFSLLGGNGLGITNSGTTITAAIDASQTAITSVLNTSLVLGRDADNQIKFGTDNQIIFEVSGGDNVIFKASGEIEASSLDISGDVDVDGTLEADAITVNGTTLAETISDTVGAMVSSNTESGITVAYQDTDNTLDFTIGTLNQDTTGNAATATALETARNIHGVSFDGTGNIDLTEVIQDTVGAMFSSNTETRITATYQDADGTIDLVVDDLDTDTQLSTENVQDIVGAMFSSNTETRISATYQDGDGTIDLVVDDMTANDNTNQLTTFQLEDGDGTEVTVSHAKEVKFVEGGRIDINWTDTDNGTDGDPYDLTFTVDNDLSNYDNSSSGFLTAHPNISAASSSDNSGRTYIQDITLDSNGHVTGIATATETVTDTNLTTEEVQDIAGGMFSSNTETGIAATYQDGDGTIDLVVDYLPATDDRDVKPNAITTSGVKQVRAYFTTLEGLTGSSGSDYQDLLVLDTYSDGSGGDMNALAFDKSTHNIYHYLADQSDSTWGTAKRIAYIENGSNNRVMTASSSSTVNGESNLTFNGHLLTVSGDNANGINMDADGSNTANSQRIFFTGSSTSAILQSSDVLSFRTGATAGSSSGTERMHIDTSGIDVNGSVIADSLDISGDIDVDGTTNLDNTDIDGTLNVSSTIFVDDIHGNSNSTNRLILDDDTNSAVANGVSLTGVNHIYLCPDETNNGTGEVRVIKGTDNDLDGGTATELFRITNAGKVGIMEDSIDANLHITGSPVVVKLERAGHRSMRFGTPDNSSKFIFADSDDLKSNIAIEIDNSRDVKIVESVGIGVAANGTAGRLDCSNDVVAFASSDKRLKENIKPLDNALDKVMQISGVEFDWKKLSKEEKKTIHGNQGHDVGVIAQEVEEVLPEVVQTRDNGYKAVKYEKIVPLLIESIKELKAEIEELKK